MSRERQYWRQRGRSYEADFVLTETHLRHERALQRVFRTICFDSVLEVGCGYGRIGARLPAGVNYVGIDVSQDMLRSARARLPHGKLINSSIEQFTTTRRFDLVLAVEVLMHIPPQRIQRAIDNMLELSSRYVVSVDWDVPTDARVDSMNWLHDYGRMYGYAARRLSIGQQALYVLDKAVTARTDSA